MRPPAVEVIAGAGGIACFGTLSPRIAYAWRRMICARAAMSAAVFTSVRRPV